MTQIKNFVVISFIWAIGMVALTATRAIIESTPAPTANEGRTTLSQRL